MLPPIPAPESNIHVLVLLLPAQPKDALLTIGKLLSGTEQYELRVDSEYGQKLRRPKPADDGGAVRLWYAAYLQQNGKHREAIAEARNALELDPLSLIVRTQVGWTYAHAGDFPSAFPYFHDVLQQDAGHL